MNGRERVAAGRRAYLAAGVDVDAGERAVALMQERLGVGRGVDLLGGVRGFGAAVALPAGYRQPVLVSATDGVGTKTAIAAALKRFETIGQDLVAMCADDIACHGAQPLFFLDYIATGRVQPQDIAELVGGIGGACEIAGCALVGGETAEHPGLMRPEEFDLAGFCVGIVEREELLDGQAAQAGDVLIGMESSGLHANGYSLIRALVAGHDLDLSMPYQEVLRSEFREQPLSDVPDREPAHLMATLGQVLLTPTRIYAPDVLALRDHLRDAGTPLRGLAHITGGGLPGNVPRVLPETLGARVDPDAWPLPSVMRLFGTLGSVEGAELRATFNGGIGMVAVVPEAAADAALDFLHRERALPAWAMGDVVSLDGTDGARYVEVARRAPVTTTA